MEVELNEISVDFGKICRLCLTDEGIMISLFSNNSKTLPERIFNLMSLEMNEDDSYPKWICSECYAQIENTEQFFESCRNSEIMLYNSLNHAVAAAFGQENINASIDQNEEEFVCKEEFAGSEGMKEDVIHECKDCNKVFETVDLLFVHRVSVHHDDLIMDGKSGTNDTGYFNCDICKKELKTKSLMSNHIRTKHLTQSVHVKKHCCCKYCGKKVFKSLQEKHFEKHHRINNSFWSTEKKEYGDCKLCFRPFRKKSSLNAHMRICHGGNLDSTLGMKLLYNCDKCQIVFVNETDLVKHYSNIHSLYIKDVTTMRVLHEKSLICFCGFVASYESELNLHKLLQHDVFSGENIACIFCEYSTESLSKLKSHLVTYHYVLNCSTKFVCYLCQFVLNSFEEVKVHIVSEHNLQFEELLVKDELGKLKTATEIDCKFCAEKFNTYTALEKHLTICSYKSYHKCWKCGKFYDSETHLKRHISEYHKTYNPVQCPACDKVFPRKMNLHNHYKRRHLKQAKTFVCTYCGASLKGKVALRSHEDRLHKNIRNFKCPHCPDSFTTSAVLKKHLLRHMADRPMLCCQICSKKFASVSGYNRHVKQHTGVKNFCCAYDNCGKLFYTKNELRRHIKFHTHDFKFVCKICKKRFVTPGGLKQHETRHTGERPYKCNICNSTYSRRDDKIKHLQKFHNVKIKRIYGKPLRKNPDDPDYVETNELDTVVIDTDEAVDGNDVVLQYFDE